jgi:hypothetical protein
MGIDGAIFINHNFYEKNIAYTLDKLKEITSYEVLFTRKYNNSEIYSGPHWTVYIDEADSVNDIFEKNNFVDIIRYYETDEEEELWFSRTNIELSSYGNKFDISGRWHRFRDFLIKSPEIDFEKYNNYFNNLLKRIIDYGKLFKSTESIIFCHDYNQDISDKLWNGTSIKEILTMDIWTIIKEIPYEIDLQKIEKYDTARFIFYTEWELQEFNLREWKNKFNKII